jgi:hypothetical protein
MTVVLHLVLQRSVQLACSFAHWVHGILLSTSHAVAAFWHLYGQLTPQGSPAPLLLTSEVAASRFFS